MLSSKLKILVFSDVHLGHRRTPTELIIDNLMKAVPDNTTSNDLDMIIIPGDLFDRFLNLPQDDTYQIHSFIGWLLTLCKKRNITLRVLEGTPSHDWKQPKLIDQINEIVGADAKHMPVLDIEHIDRFGIDILYIPDEWSHDNDDTWNQVQRLMIEKQLDKVDFTVMHGQFAYQLPPHVDAPVHNPDRYADITRHYVFCGHVHIPSQYRNIIVPGSFDRLSHGEEGAKGSWIITVNPEGDDTVVFNENKTAMTYMTIDCVGLDIDDVLSLVENKVNACRYGSRIRISASDDDPINSSIHVLSQKYPGLHFESHRSGRTKSTKETLVDMRATYKTIPITPESVSTLIKAELLKQGIGEQEQSPYIERLNEVI